MIANSVITNTLEIAYNILCFENMSLMMYHVIFTRVKNKRSFPTVPTLVCTYNTPRVASPAYIHDKRARCR